MDALTRLEDWLALGGARFDGLELADRSDGRTALATEPIASGREVLCIPPELLITRELAQASTIGRAITASGVELDSKHSWLAAWLLAERAVTASPWAPYLETLPGTFPHAPLFFPAARELLAGTLAELRLTRLRASIDADHAALRDRVPALAGLPWDDFAWARMTVLTRVFGLQSGNAKSEGLVPLADMLNHARPRQTAWRLDARGDFVITALRSFAPGDEVHDSYGAKCSSRFFVHYGFVLPDNPDDEAVLRFPQPRAEDAWRVERARAALGAHAPASLAFHVKARYAPARTRRLFAFLRAVLADDVQALRIAKARHPHRIGPGTRGNERRVLTAIAMAARASLARFPTTVAEDNAILGAGAVSTPVRLCVEVRRAEKRVLAAYLRLAQLGLELLARPATEWEAARRAAETPLEREYLSALPVELCD